MSEGRVNTTPLAFRSSPHASALAFQSSVKIGSMYKIWIDEPMIDSCLPMFAGVAELVGPGAPTAEIANCDATLVPGSRIWDGALMDRATKMKVLSRIGIGYDNINVSEASARNIIVCYAPDAPTISTAEHALALMMAAAKHLRGLDENTRAGQARVYAATHKGMELAYKTIGLIGMGRIGSRVAKACVAMDMRVIVYDPFVNTERAAALGVQKVDSLEALLAQSDVVSLHLPSTPETRHLMNAERLAQMKPGSILINAARGALIDEAALTDALKSGHLLGAGLDVFHKEPPDIDHPFLKLDNVVLTPHVASHTDAGHHRLYETAALQALQVLRGERAASMLNAQIWETRRK